MAFPTIPTAGANRLLTSRTTTSVSTHPSPSLTTLVNNSGDLLICLIVGYAGSAADTFVNTWGGGFTQFFEKAGTGTVGLAGAYKWSDGTETGTFNITTTLSEPCCVILMSIPGAHATTPPEAGGYNTGAGVDAGSAGLSPSWGSADTLYIALCCYGETSTAGSFTGVTGVGVGSGLSDYADTGINVDAVSGCEGGVGFAQSTNTSFAGSFVGDTSNTRVGAITIAVRPVVATVVDLAGSGAVSGGATGTASVARGLASSASASTGATAALGVTRPLAASAPSSSQAGAALARERPLAATAPASAGATGELGKIKLLTGSAPAASSASGTLTRAIGLATHGDAASGATAALQKTLALVGSAPAASQPISALARNRTLAAIGSAAASATAVLRRAIGLTSHADASSSASGAFRRAVGLQATSSAASGATGALTGGGFAGSAAVSALARGVLTLAKVFSASANAANGAQALLGRSVGHSGVISGASTLTSDIPMNRSPSLSATAPISASAVALLSVESAVLALQGVIAASSSASAELMIVAGEPTPEESLGEGSHEADYTVRTGPTGILIQPKGMPRVPVQSASDRARLLKLTGSLDPELAASERVWQGQRRFKSEAEKRAERRQRRPRGRGEYGG